MCFSDCCYIVLLFSSSFFLFSMPGMTFLFIIFFFFCKQKSAYDMRMSDWSSDVCSSDLLDMLTSVPWKGYSYMVGEVELSANRSWAFDDIDRIGGFARMSTALSVMIAIYSLFIAAFIQPRVLRLMLYIAALIGIVLTTNKSTAAAYVLTLLMLIVTAYRFASATAFLVAVLVGLMLPMASLVLSLDPNAANNGSLLASFADRLINSWPNFIEVITREGWGWWGAGFGAVGSTGKVYPVPGLELLGIADNTALYLWGMLGVFGVLLYLQTFPLMMLLQERGPRRSSAFVPLVFCTGLVEGGQE